MEALLRGEKTPLGNQEGVSGDAQAGMVMKAAPAAALEVVEPDFLLEFPVIALDPPSQLDQADQVLQGGCLCQ